MKRTICVWLILALLLSALSLTAAFAEGGNTRVVLIQCEQQDFSTACLEGLTWEWKDDLGVQIYTQEPGYNPYMLIYWNDTGEKFDAKKYLDEVFTPEMQQKYGERLLEVEPYKTYTVQGVEMPGIKYRYVTNNGSEGILFRLFDLRWGGNVCYTLRYYPDDPDDTLNALAIAVHFFHPGAHYYDEGGNGGSAPADMGNYSVSAAPSIVPATAPYSCVEFTATLPNGWKVVTGGFLETFSFKCYDPECPERSLFLISEMAPLLKSQSAREIYQQLTPGSLNPLSSMIYYAPVLPRPTIKGLLENFDDVLTSLTKHPSPAVEAIPVSVLPGIHQANVLESATSPMLAQMQGELSGGLYMSAFRDISVNRFTFLSDSGAACEGIAGGAVLEGYDPNGTLTSVDLWFHSVHCFMGVTAPVGELQELAPTLLECLTSFRYTDSYIQTALNQGLYLPSTQDMSGTRASYTDAWEDRDRTYDVLSQEYSDATLGYDRLYDSETGEIYRAETGFWDEYDLHRYEYQNPNLQIIDDSTRDYYLRSVDYTITR